MTKWLLLHLLFTAFKTMKAFDGKKRSDVFPLPPVND
jgi:hypothetical protein